jgi:Zn-dependent protease with chaperone function
MVSFSLAVTVTAVVAVLFAAAVGLAGGWRPTPLGGVPVPEFSPELSTDHVLEPGADHAPEPAPVRMPPALVAWAWRLRVVAEIYRAALLIALGLTPLGARFVHLVAPEGTHWRTAAAMLAIVVGVWGPPRLWSTWWLTRVRRSCPALVRPRWPWWLRPARLLWLALAAYSAAVLLTDVAGLGNSGGSGRFVIVLVLFAVVGILMRQALAVLKLERLPRPERLEAALESLTGQPGETTVIAVAGWRTPLANAAAIASLRRQGIVVAPPLLDLLTDPQLRAVLAHELAHLRNHDTWWRLLRWFLMLLTSAAVALTLYTIPLLRRMAGLHTAHLTAQALPFLLVIGFLAVKVLRVAELRASRAEEAAADRRAVETTGDVQACVEAMGMLGSTMGTPASWTLPRRLLTASHPATAERLRLISASSGGALVAGLPVGGRPVPGRYRAAFASVTVVALAVATFALANPLGAVAAPQHLGWYRIMPPARFDGGAFSGSSGSQSSVWSAGITKFSGAVPVNVVYNQQGQPWLYMWGAYGDLANPSGELSAFWQATDVFSTLRISGVASAIDTWPTGPLGGYLQCAQSDNTCAWADGSGIVAVSQLPPSEAPVLIPTTTDPNGFYSEGALAALTKSFRGAAELLRHVRRSHSVS